MAQGTFRPPLHVVWSTRRLDLSCDWQRRWYVQQVLTHGAAADVRALDWDEVESLLPRLHLPPAVRSLWEEYFASARAGAGQRPHPTPSPTPRPTPSPR